jgi:tRNA-dihydrouridine synthase B
VLDATGADGVMIGRAAQGRPWLFREIEHFLATGRELPGPLTEEIRAVLVEHLHDLYVFYGRETGLRVARKHVAWYTKGLPGADAFRRRLNGLETCEAQLAAVDGYFGELAQQQQRLRYDEKEELAA